MQQAGNIETAEMLKTFNCGIGFIMVVAPEQQDQVVAALEANGEHPRVIGKIVPTGTEPAANQFLAR